MNTEVGVCVVLGVAGRWRKYRWINAHHHCHYNLLFLSLPSLLSPSLSFRKVGNFVCSLSFVSRQPKVTRRVRMCAVVTFNYWQTIWLLRAIVVWIVIIGGRWLLVISYDVMRADDVSAEDLQPLQERLFQLGPQIKHRFNEFLQFWWVPTLVGRQTLSLRCFHKEISTQRNIYGTLSVVEFLGKVYVIIIRNGSCLSRNVVTF